jgi:hypothetical protein
MKRYFLTTQYKSIVAGIWLIPLLSMNMIFVYLAAWYLFLLIAITIIIGTILFVRSIYLDVSENGIECHSPFSLKSKWENLEAISFSKYGKWQEGLIIRQPLVLYRGSYQRILKNPDKIFVPLSVFAENWRGSDLGQQIRQYAPHLFEQESKKSA